MGEEIGSDLGGVGAVAGGQVDSDDGGGMRSGDEADEPAMGGCPGAKVGGAGFAGNEDAAAVGGGGDAVGGGVGEAGLNHFGCGGTGMVLELKGEPAVGGGKFEGSDGDAVEAEEGEDGFVGGAGVAEDRGGFSGGEGSLAEQAGGGEQTAELAGGEGAGDGGEVGVAGPGECLPSVHWVGGGV